MLNWFVKREESDLEESFDIIYLNEISFLLQLGKSFGFVSENSWEIVGNYFRKWLAFCEKFERFGVFGRFWGVPGTFLGVSGALGASWDCFC